MPTGERVVHVISLLDVVALPKRLIMQSPAIPTTATIRHLTALLAQADVRDSIPPKSEQLSHSMKFLAHISTMLNFCPYNGTVVAVTGQLDKDKAKAIIVVSKKSFQWRIAF
jgi:hypothetical protein